MNPTHMHEQMNAPLFRSFDMWDDDLKSIDNSIKGFDGGNLIGYSGISI